MKDFNLLIDLLTEARKKKKYSLRQVERILKHKGVKYTFTAIKKLEDKKISTISPLLLKAFAEMYNLDSVELFKIAGFLDKEFTLTKAEFVDFQKYGVSLFERIKPSSILEIYDTNEFYNISEDDDHYVVKMNDSSMQGPERQNIPAGSYLMISTNISQKIGDMNNEIGIFKYLDRFYIRKMEKMKDRVFLRAFNKRYVDIMVTDTKELKCEGKIIKCYYIKEF